MSNTLKPARRRFHAETGRISRGSLHLVRGEQARPTWGHNRQQQLDASLREAVVAATNSVPGTKPTWVYRIRNGSAPMTIRRIGQLMAINVRVDGIIGIITQAFSSDAHEWNRDRDRAA